MLIAALAAVLFAAAGLVGLVVRQHRALARVARAAATLGGGGSAAARIGDAAQRLAALEHRVAQRHPLSGLPTREPLFARMDADRAAGGEGGLLGVLWFADHERLLAFDTALADRVLATLTARVTDMLGDGPMVAQVDRARVALWYGPQVPAESARAEMTALCYALGDRLSDDGHDILPDVRLGMAAATEAVPSPKLLTRAAAALSAAGATPAPELDDPIEAARRDYAIEQGLRQAVAREEFELRFQPLVDAAAGRVCGAEALLRWHHPDHGNTSPAAFMPIAEAAGLADEIGLWVLNAAAREARAWQRMDLGPIRVAVNVSGHQLRRPDMCQLVSRTLARHTLPADRLEIELTETVASGDIARAAALFEQIRALGVSIAIDDFGTGYSSLSALRRLGFDKLKIDREFVTEVDRRRDSQAICQSMLALGRGLGIRVLAEGVETAAEYRWLRAQGCAHFQGYYFSPPLGRTEFVDFARDTARLVRLAAPPLERLSA